MKEILDGEEQGGAKGATGQGVASGGTTGQGLVKSSNTDFHTEWSNAGSGDLISTNNLSDLANAVTARTNLGVDASGTDNSTDVTLGGTGTYITIAGQVITVDPIANTDLASQNISQWTNNLGYITATLTDEQVQDLVGAMVTGNTETLITVTYQDADGTIDFVVDNDLSNYSNTTTGFIADITGSPLSELSDVTITTIATGEILKWNGSIWVNQTLAEAGIEPAKGADDNYVTDAEKIVIGNISGTNTGDEPTASTTVSGISESATVTETNTGTDAVRHVTPAGLAGSALQTKVDGIETGATADQTGAQIKTAYEGEADTNAYTDSEKTVVGNTSGTNTGDQTIPTVSDTAYNATSWNTNTDAATKNAIRDKVDAMDTTIAANTAKNSYPSADSTKLAGVETAADVTDTSNVTSAGALMDSELTSIADVKALNQGVTNSSTPTFAGVVLGGNITRDGDTNTVIQGSADQWNFVTGASTRFTINNTAVSISNVDLDLNTNNIIDVGTVDGRDVATDGTKLDGIETAADVTDATNVAAAGAAIPTGTPDGTKFLRDDETWQAIPAGGDAQTADPLSQFAATTSLQLKGTISDETGSGALVFGTSPAITTPTGIVKGDVGLGNVDNTSDATKDAATATLTNKDLSSTTNTYPVGHTIQVVSATNGTNTSSASTTYVDTGLTASITPASSSNKVKITISQMYYCGSSANTGSKMQLLKGSSSLALIGVHIGYPTAGTRSHVSYTYTDSPATTSATTYKIQFARSTGAGTVYVNQDSTISSIVLEEIVG